MKKIYITTDIHNFMHYSQEHKAGFYDETEHLIKYLDLAKIYGIKITIFVTGKLLTEKKDMYKEILSKYDVELGGHTFDCYTSYIKGQGYIYKKIYNCAYGSKNRQDKDIYKTTNALNTVGVKPVSWRTHAYDSNLSTRDVLLKYGYKLISDLNQKRYKKDGLLELPPNTLPDHENIIHPGLKNNPNARLSISEWLETLKEQVTLQEDSIILAHATCHKYLDNFQTLEKLFQWIQEKDYQTFLMKDNICKQ